MSILLTIAASSAFASGTKSACLPRRRASKATGSTPLTGRTLPSSANSPTKLNFSNAEVFSSSATAIIPSAIGRLKLGPSFLMSAGARLIVVRLRDHLYALLAIAVRTRSLLSFTAGTRQAHNDHLRVARAGVDFAFHFVSVNAVNCGRINLCQHGRERLS